MKEFIDQITYWLKQEDIYVVNVKEDGEGADKGWFLHLTDEDGEELSPGPWADPEIVIQSCPSIKIHDNEHEMVRVNSMPMAKISKLVVAVVVGYPA